MTENLQNPRHALHSARFVLLGAALLTALFFAALVVEMLRQDRSEREKLIEVTNAFTRAFSENRVDGNPVPATFRRIGMDHLNAADARNAADDGPRTTVRMPGTRGLAIGTVERNPKLQAVMAEMAAAGSQATPVHGQGFEDGRLLARSVFPSIATDEGCVTCHNATLGLDIYEVGDVMGAFVVETDLTPNLRNIGYYSLAAFLFAILAGAAILRREQRRAAQTIEALELRVGAETRQRKAEAHAAFLASHDPLTGLANRKVFRDRLDPLARTHDPIVVVVDIDDFKRINDSFGHDAGDAVLKTIARRFESCVSSFGGLAARTGGDEFAAVLTGLSDDEIHRLGTDLTESLKTPVLVETAQIQPSVSIGIARMSEAVARSAVGVLKSADVALYNAKALGKAQFSIFDKDLKATVGRRMEMGQALSKAIANDDITAFFQPQIDLQTGQTRGFEALARWHWQGEDIAPDVFISIAEESGLIAQLDDAIMHKAAQFAMACAQDTGQLPEIACNVSAASLLQGGLIDRVRDILHATGLPPSALTVEITETVVMDNWNSAAPELDGLQALGVSVSLDDFGTGHSALSYLTRFPFDELKVDRSFVTQLANDPVKQIISLHMIQMARDLDKRVVVEGIETTCIADMLYQKGADIAQGFLYSRPLSAADALTFYSTNRWKESA
ncbi:MAG: putative bifunctional diguanylate cyclase/phosphodiesterase [Yoonia sp.]|uniref:putative bifunctional diguanylate cyclase/phosphodiesterase n=1 Tax=Yoonia sp. TaxID=2212373 RepID=UPI003EF2ECD2